MLFCFPWYVVDFAKLPCGVLLSLVFCVCRLILLVVHWSVAALAKLPCGLLLIWVFSIFSCLCVFCPLVCC